MRQIPLLATGLALLLMTAVSGAAETGSSPNLLTLEAFENLFDQANRQAATASVSPETMSAAAEVWKSLHHSLVDADARIQQWITAIQASEGTGELQAIRELIDAVAGREQVIAVHYRRLERVLAGQPAAAIRPAPTPSSDPERDLYRSRESVDPPSIKLRFEPEDLQNTEID